MIEYLFLFIFGLVVGSFLSVVIYRETKEEKDENKMWLPSWAVGRSKCDHCEKKIEWYDNIPLLSFIWLGGKCRYCKKKININYPLFELFVAVEFIWIYWLLQRFSFFAQMEGLFSLGVLVYWLFIFSISMALIMIDIKRQILPDSLIISGILVSGMRLFFTQRWEFLLSALGLLVFYLAIYYLSFLVFRREGLGFGDVKLSLFVALVLGWWQWVIVATIIAFLTGSIVSVILILMRKKNFHSSLAFGPFMLIGMMIAKIGGEFLWGWYTSFLGF